MPTQRQFKVFFAFFSYGGNGGVASLIPPIRKWWGQTVIACHCDPRIGYNGDVPNFVSVDVSDTPITMTRNLAVDTAKRWGADFLVMIDSDNEPDLYLKTRPQAKPFFKSSLDFMIERYDKGPHVVFAPYGGPPPHPVKGGEENVYVFQYRSFETGADETAFALSGVSREQACMMRGIQDAAAGPTGCIMYDMRAFDLIEHPYFDYEWTDAKHTAKGSTEDVYNTRNISLQGCLKLGYNPMFCNWDAWAGHAKPKTVGAPEPIPVENVAEMFRKAANGPSRKKVLVDFESSFAAELEDGRHAMRAAAQRALDEAAKDSAERSHHIEGHWKVGEMPEEVANALWASPNAGMAMPRGDQMAIGHLVQQVAMAAKARGGAVRIVEVGTWIGNTAILMAEILTEMDVPFRIDCVDTFAGTPTDHTRQMAQAGGGSTLQRFLENTKRFFPKIRAVQKDSLTAAADFEGKADLIFLDADHAYAGVKADIEAWLPHLRHDGVICGHDYNEEFPDVARAVHEAFGEEMIDAYADSCVWSRRNETADERDARLREAYAMGMLTPPDMNGESLVTNQGLGNGGL